MWIQCAVWFNSVTNHTAIKTNCVALLRKQFLIVGFTLIFAFQTKIYWFLVSKSKAKHTIIYTFGLYSILECELRWVKIRIISVVRCCKWKNFSNKQTKTEMKNSFEQQELNFPYSDWEEEKNAQTIITSRILKPAKPTHYIQFHQILYLDTESLAWLESLILFNIMFISAICCLCSYFTIT